LCTFPEHAGELGRKKGGPPLGEGRLNAADDVIGTLSARVTELSKRVALLEAELQSAEKRIEIYEDHDSQIQEALSGALKAAYQIRHRAETAAEQILEQAREQRRMILSEIERLQDERDRLQDEIATGRRSSIAAVTTQPLSSDSAASELRAVASEALKGLFEEIVEDFRTTQARTMPPRQPAAAEAPDVPRAPQARREPPVVTHEDIETAAPTYEAMARMRRSTIEQEEIGAPAPMEEAPIDEAPVAEPEMPPAPIEEVEEIAETETMRPISEGPSMEERIAEEQRETERRATELRELEERAEAERREAERREAEQRAEDERREAQERADAERREAEERAAAERVAAEQRAAEERAAFEQRAAEERAVMEQRAAEQRAAMDRAVAEARASAERAAADRAAAERAQAEARAIEARVAAERAEMERVAAERAAAERAAAERAAAERAAAERAAAERAAAEKAALERAAAEYAAAERAAAERAAAEAARRAAPPLEVVRTPVDMGEIAPPRVEAASPTSDIQLVLSPVASFPRLVEIERQIQALPVVRTLYVRDFRGGAATLTIALRSSMTPEEFAGLLRGLQQPRLRLVAGSRNTLEMRVEGEAGVA